MPFASARSRSAPRSTSRRVTLEVAVARRIQQRRLRAGRPAGAAAASGQPPRMMPTPFVARLFVRQHRTAVSAPRPGVCAFTSAPADESACDREMAVAHRGHQRRLVEAWARARRRVRRARAGLRRISALPTRAAMQQRRLSPARSRAVRHRRPRRAASCAIAASRVLDGEVQRPHAVAPRREIRVGARPRAARRGLAIADAHYPVQRGGAVAAERVHVGSPRARARAPSRLGPPSRPP